MMSVVHTTCCTNRHTTQFQNTEPHATMVLSLLNKHVCFFLIPLLLSLLAVLLAMLYKVGMVASGSEVKAVDNPKALVLALWSVAVEKGCGSLSFIQQLFPPSLLSLFPPATHTAPRVPRPPALANEKPSAHLLPHSAAAVPAAAAPAPAPAPAPAVPAAAGPSAAALSLAPDLPTATELVAIVTSNAMTIGSVLASLHDLQQEVEEIRREVATMGTNNK